MKEQASIGCGRRAVKHGRDARGSVVIVEDDEDVRFVCAEALRERGFHVEECETVAAGRVAIARVVPHILLLDRELPDGCGLDLARWLRGHVLYDAMSIVAFSGRTAPDEIEQAFAAGCDAFVAKPCTSASLGLQMERLMERRLRSSEAHVERDVPAESEVRQVGSRGGRGTERFSR